MGALRKLPSGDWTFWVWPRPRGVLRFVQLRSSDHETRVLPRGEICWAPKRRFRRRIAALDSRPAFQGRYLGPPSGSRAASAALESRTPLRFAISSVAPRRGMGFGLPRPALKG